MPELLLRPLETHAEREACVELQKTTWGEAFDDVVSAALMQVTSRIGGVTAGAFDRDRLVGIIFGVSGFRGDARVHWSHMLAVEGSHRSMGLGRALKIYQREIVMRAGVEIMFWTFEPLEARNAHFNLNRLKAEIDAYVIDMYGNGDTSPLHHGIGTDRFIARWPLASPQVVDALDRDLAALEWYGDRARVHLPMPERIDETPNVDIPPERPEVVEERRGLVEVPCGIQRLKQDDLETAIEWRAYSRHAIRTYLDRGYTATAFVRRSTAEEDEAARCFYVFDRS